MARVLIWLVFPATDREMRQAQRWHFSSALWQGKTPGGESCSVSFGKHTAKLNGWSINFSGIDLHQFCLHAHTRSHFIVNQSFWKHLTEGPVLTNKPSIPAACVATLIGPQISSHTNICSISIAFYHRLTLSFAPPTITHTQPRSVPTACRVLMVWVARSRQERLGIFTTPLKITQG